MSAFCSTIDELDDFLAFVAMYAPDQFLPRHGMDLAIALQEIEVGLRSCAAEIGNEQLVAQLERIAEQAKASFQSGDEVAGAHLFQDMSQLLKR